MRRFDKFVVIKGKHATGPAFRCRRQQNPAHQPRSETRSTGMCKSNSTWRTSPASKSSGLSARTARSATASRWQSPALRRIHDKSVCALTGIPVERFKSLASAESTADPFMLHPEARLRIVRIAPKNAAGIGFHPSTFFSLRFKSGLRLRSDMPTVPTRAPRPTLSSTTSGDVGRIFWLASPTIGDPSPDDLWVRYVRAR